MPTRRRAFLSSLGAFAVLPTVRQEAELVLHNGNILTVDPGQPRAQAVAIARGRFVAVGDDADVLNLAAARTRKLDLGGRTVVPGFIDAHSHPASAGYAHLKQVDCAFDSIGKIVDALRARAAKTPPGQWVLGFKYDDTKTAEARFLTRADLDAVSPAHPVYVQHRGGHTAYVNSRALAAAKVSEATADPEGGRFYRDESGRLTGRVAERATDVIEAIIPGALSRDERRQGVKLIGEMMSRSGLTSATDAGGSPADLAAYQDAREADELGVRVYCHIREGFLDAMLAAGVRTGLGDEWVRVGAVKLVCDGSISERTAWLAEPYVGRPSDRGILVTPEPALHETARKAHEAGWQVGVHANGDAAIDMVLRVFERLQREQPRRDPRFRLEHCTVITDELVRRIKALGAIPTPFSTYVYWHGEKMKEYGAERLERMFALRSFLDAGIRATQASDYPPGPFEPMMALQSEVTRTDSKGNVWGARQRITVEEALRVGTLHGAYASFEERLKGSIEAGKLADLVVLGGDPLRTDPSELVRIPVHATMVGGRWVFEA
ncbi:MAG TPA: amidohydrolase [Vicinamibacteria bacterium]|nr:amidohydrolase [Vicinamibacteria bacterium]